MEIVFVHYFLNTDVFGLLNASAITPDLKGFILDFSWCLWLYHSLHVCVFLSLDIQRLMKKVKSFPVLEEDTKTLKNIQTNKSHSSAVWVEDACQPF